MLPPRCSFHGQLSMENCLIKLLHLDLCLNTIFSKSPPSGIIPEVRLECLEERGRSAWSDKYSEPEAPDRKELLVCHCHDPAHIWKWEVTLQTSFALNTACSCNARKADWEAKTERISTCFSDSPNSQCWKMLPRGEKRTALKPTRSSLGG